MADKHSYPAKSHNLPKKSIYKKEKDKDRDKNKNKNKDKDKSRKISIDPKEKFDKNHVNPDKAEDNYDEHESYHVSVDRSNHDLSTVYQEGSEGADATMESQSKINDSLSSFSSTPIPPIPELQKKESLDRIALNPLRRRAPKPTENPRRQIPPLRLPTPPPPPAISSAAPPVIELKAVQSRTNRLELQKRIREMQEKATLEKSLKSQIDPSPIVKLNSSIIEYPLINKYRDMRAIQKDKPSTSLNPSKIFLSPKFMTRKHQEKIKAIRERNKPPPPPPVKRTMAEVMNPGMNLGLYTGAPSAHGKKRLTPMRKRYLEMKKAKIAQRTKAKVSALKENDDARQVARNLKYKSVMLDDGIYRHDLNIGQFDERLLRMNSPIQDLLIPPKDVDVFIGKPIPEKKSFFGAVTQVTVRALRELIEALAIADQNHEALIQISSSDSDLLDEQLQELVDSDNEIDTQALRKIYQRTFKKSDLEGDFDEIDTSDPETSSIYLERLLAKNADRKKQNSTAGTRLSDEDKSTPPSKSIKPTTSSKTKNKDNTKRLTFIERHQRNAERNLLNSQVKSSTSVSSNDSVGSDKQVESKSLINDSTHQAGSLLRASSSNLLPKSSYKSDISYRRKKRVNEVPSDPIPAVPSIATNQLTEENLIPRTSQFDQQSSLEEQDQLVSDKQIETDSPTNSVDQKLHESTLSEGVPDIHSSVNDLSTSTSQLKEETPPLKPSELVQKSDTQLTPSLIDSKPTSTSKQITVNLPNNPTIESKDKSLPVLNKDNLPKSSKDSTKIKLDSLEKVDINDPDKDKEILFKPIFSTDSIHLQQSSKTVSPETDDENIISQSQLISIPEISLINQKSKTLDPEQSVIITSEEEDNSEDLLATVRKEIESYSSTEKGQLHTKEQTASIVSSNESLEESIPLDLSGYPYTLKHEIPVIQHPSEESVGGLKKPKIDITPKLSFSRNVQFPSEHNIDRASDNLVEESLTENNLQLVVDKTNLPEDNQLVEPITQPIQRVKKSKSNKAVKNTPLEITDKANFQSDITSDNKVRRPSSFKSVNNTSKRVRYKDQFDSLIEDNENIVNDAVADLDHPENQSHFGINQINTDEQGDPNQSIAHLEPAENDNNLVKINNDLSSEGFNYKDNKLNSKDNLKIKGTPESNRSRSNKASKKGKNKATNKNKKKLYSDPKVVDSSESDKDNNSKKSSDSDKDQKINKFSESAKDNNSQRELLDSDKTSLGSIKTLKEPSEQFQSLNNSKEVFDLRSSFGTIKSLKEFSESKESIDSVTSISKLFTSNDLNERDSKSSILSQELFDDRSNTFSFSTTKEIDTINSIETSSILLSIPNMDSKEGSIIGDSVNKESQDIDLEMSKIDSTKSSKDSITSEKSLVLDSIDIEKDDDDIEKSEMTFNLETTLNKSLDSKSDADQMKSSKLESLSYDAEETSMEIKEDDKNIQEQSTSPTSEKKASETDIKTLEGEDPQFLIESATNEPGKSIEESDELEPNQSAKGSEKFQSSSDTRKNSTNSIRNSSYDDDEISLRNRNRQRKVKPTQLEKTATTLVNAESNSDMGVSESDLSEDESPQGVVAEERTDDEDDAGDMIVLDPDHPLMQRFQGALTEHLNKQLGKSSLILNELNHELKSKKKEREDVGVQLYGIQQDLAKNQMNVERLHDDLAEKKECRKRAENALDEMKGVYGERSNSVSEERRNAARLLTEVENLSLRLFYMETAKNDVRGDIAVMKRAAEKTENVVAKSEIDKHKQDLYVNRLIERVDKLHENINMYNAQIIAQKEETTAAAETLREAKIEIESINLEKKQLFHQWNCSLIGMRRRDQARSAMAQALDQEKQSVLSMETEVEGYRKATQKVQEKNEQLTLIYNKAESDIATTKKMMTHYQNKMDALKSEYATYSRMLKETENSLTKANGDKNAWEMEQKSVCKQVESRTSEKLRLEEKILNCMHKQLTIDKSAKYTLKMIRNLRQKTKMTETHIARVENEISTETLEVLMVKARNERLEEQKVKLENEIQMKTDIVSRCNVETVKRNTIIERKQGIIDQLNKKIDGLLLLSGGVELGPMEVNINSLQKSIVSEQEQTTTLQNMWLRNQNQLVTLTKERDNQISDINNIKKKQTIMEQRKMRIEGEIEGQKSEIRDQERDVRAIENDLKKLNIQLHNKTGEHKELNAGNELMQTDFIAVLKAAELDSIKRQNILDSLLTDKEGLLSKLIEAERQIMLWEKKTQLARETQAAVSSDIGEGEIKAMRAEIHRMEVRHVQLKKAQEHLIHDMEKSVSRRDTIVTRGEAQSKLHKNVVTKGKFQRQLVELRKKIKNAIAVAANCDKDIGMLQGDQSQVSGNLDCLQNTLQKVQNCNDVLNEDLEGLSLQKQKNLHELIARQKKTKLLMQIEQGTLKIRNRKKTFNYAKSKDKQQFLLSIGDRIAQELPNLKSNIQKINAVYGL